MTLKQRIMTVLTKGQADYIPWVPRIDLWFNYHKKRNTLPEAYENLSIWDIHRKLGLAIYSRRGKVFTEKIKNLNIKIYYADRDLEKEFSPSLLNHLLGQFNQIEKIPIEFIYDLTIRTSDIKVQHLTSLGQVSTKFTYPIELRESGIIPYQTEHMIKSSEDYKIVEHIIENTELLPTYHEFLQTEKEINEDGVVFASIPYCPINQIMQEYLGYEKFCYELYDHRKKLHHLLEVLTDKRHKMQEICARSPATLIECGGNWDASSISPSLFKQYFVPYFRRFADLLHKQGKVLITHADGEMKNLLEVFLETGIDVAEAFTPSPMTSCTLADARKTWNSQVIIWGGMPTVMLSANISKQRFRSYMNGIFKQISPGDHFILGVGDNTPVDADLQRLVIIDNIVKSWS